MNSDQMKRQVAEAALVYVPHGCVLGVGTGSTVNHFIAALADRKIELAGAKVVFAPLDAGNNFAINGDAIRRRVTPRTRMIAGDPTARWRSDASCSTFFSSRWSIVWGATAVIFLGA